MTEFDDLQASGTALLAAFDQYAAICRPVMETLATFEKACVAAGMSDRLAAAFTMKLAEGCGWPLISSGGDR